MPSTAARTPAASSSSRTGGTTRAPRKVRMPAISVLGKSSSPSRRPKVWKWSREPTSVAISCSFAVAHHVAVVSVAVAQRRRGRLEALDRHPHDPRADLPPATARDADVRDGCDPGLEHLHHIDPERDAAEPEVGD